MIRGRGLTIDVGDDAYDDVPTVRLALMDVPTYPMDTWWWVSCCSWSSTRKERRQRLKVTASDIMFTNRFFSRFFTHGQVIETHRGKGVFQPAVDEAVRLVQSGAWVHIFPEGRVNQRTIHPPGGLFRFKWGVGRIVMDSKVLPEIIPMWISRESPSSPLRCAPSRRSSEFALCALCAGRDAYTHERRRPDVQASTKSCPRPGAGHDCSPEEAAD